MTANSPTMMAKPLVTVVVPCFNQSRYAYEAILSAKHAYSGPLQIIVVNDGSTERNTGPKLNSAADSLRDDRCAILIVSQENRGLPGARNAGIRLAEGTYIQLLDCDDLLIPGKIDRQIAHFCTTVDLSVSITDCIYSNESLDKFERYTQLLQEWVFDLQDFASHWERGFSIPIHSALFAAAIFTKRMFHETQRAKEDWLFWTHLVNDGYRIAFMGTAGAIYRIHDTSICRSMAEIGREWLLASIEIDRIVRDKIPGFLDNAVSWYAQNYSGKSSIVEPIASAAPTKLEPQRSVVTQKIYRRWTPPDDKPMVSIVIPVYEHFEYLENCLHSAMAQMDGQVEIIVVDDASSDARIRPYLELMSRTEGILYSANLVNLGISRTLNHGISLARGKYIAFLDCDDMLPPGSLLTAMNYIRQAQGCDYFFSDRYDIGEDGDILKTVRYGGYLDDRFIGNFRSDLLNGMIASHLKIISKTAIERSGGFDPQFSGVQDWDLALKICVSGKTIYLPKPLYCYRVHTNTVTNSDRRAQFWRSNVVRRKFTPDFIAADEDRAAKIPMILAPKDVHPRTLADLWSSQPLVLDARAGICHDELWRLREFNSYFDGILCGSPEVFASLLGYVWSPNILKLN